MVKERMDLLELLRKGGMDGDVDFLREALRVVVEGIMDAEVSSRIGAEYGERSPERVRRRPVERKRAYRLGAGHRDGGREDGDGPPAGDSEVVYGGDPKITFPEGRLCPLGWHVTAGLTRESPSRLPILPRYS